MQKKNKKNYTSIIVYLSESIPNMVRKYLLVFAYYGWQI